MPSFRQQVLAAYKQGLAREMKILKVYKSQLKSATDANDNEFLKLTVNQHERLVKTYKDLIDEMRPKE